MAPWLNSPWAYQKHCLQQELQLPNQGRGQEIISHPWTALEHYLSEWQPKENNTIVTGPLKNSNNCCIGLWPGWTLTDDQCQSFCSGARRGPWSSLRSQGAVAASPQMGQLSLPAVTFAILETTLKSAEGPELWSPWSRLTLVCWEMQWHPKCSVECERNFSRYLCTYAHLHPCAGVNWLKYLIASKVWILLSQI